MSKEEDQTPLLADTQSDGGSVPGPPDTTPDSALGNTDTQSDGGSVPGPPDTTPDSALGNTDTQSDGGSVPGPPDTTPDSALGNTDTQSDGGSVPCPPDTTPDSALGNTDTQSDGGSVPCPPDTTPDSALGNTDTQSDGGSVPGPPDTTPDSALGNTDTALQASTSRTALSSISDELNDNKEKKILSEKFLRSIAADIGKEWYLLSICLGLTQAEVERIQYDGTCDPETKIVKALLKWRSKSFQLSARVQLEHLIKELLENGRKDLVEKYGKFLDESLLEQISVGDESRTDDETTNNMLWKHLFLLNEEETQRVPVSPLQKSGSLPIDEIYAPVYIKEDMEYKSKGRNIGRIFNLEKKSIHVQHPNDVFYINRAKDERARNIFLLGDAGHGKTVFCRKLLKHWCQGHEKRRTIEPLNDWEEILCEFDYLFQVKLRHVDECRTSLIDMICHDVFERHPGCHDAIRDVLSSGLKKCLVVVDGLDEWKISNNAKAKLKSEGLPNLDGMGNSTILWTSRPWTFDELIETIGSTDRVLEIHGLDHSGIDIIVDNILTNFYEFQVDSIEYKTEKTEINEKLKDQTLKDLMKIPLIAVACVQIWQEDKKFGNSKTNFYIALIDLLISRALKKKDITESDFEQLEQSSRGNDLISRIFVENEYAQDFFPVLEKLGEIAFNDLVSKEKHLVFKKRYLQKCLGKLHLDLALRVGVLSQCEAPSNFNEEKVSVCFFHKSLQEFLAAMHVTTGKMSCDSFCTYLNDFQVCFELENVLIFISGLNSSNGHLILQHIASLGDSDSEVIAYRETCHGRFRHKMKLLYNLQLNCYRELEQGMKTRKTIGLVKSENVISDVYLDKNSDETTVQNTLNILLRHHSSLKSLTLLSVSNRGDNGINSKVLSEILDNIKSLQGLFISFLNSDEILYRLGNIFNSLTTLALFQLTVTWDVILHLPTALSENKVLKNLGLWGIQVTDNRGKVDERYPAPLSGVIQILPFIPMLTSLCIRVDMQEDKLLLMEVSHKLSYLQEFHYFGSLHSEDHVIANVYYDALIASSALNNCPMLRTFLIYDCCIGDGEICLQSIPSTRNVEKIGFVRVSMSEECWVNFILSLMEVKFEINVELYESDISEECQSMLCSLPYFEIITSDINADGKLRIEFKKLPIQL